MCGVVGSVDFGGGLGEDERALVVAMRDTMVTRGPDGAGLWASPDGRAIFGHRRLSIIDLSESASQPMTTEDGRFCLVFNGEIYNHQELRAELVAEGVTTWRTGHSDTEVILRGFERYGIDFVERLRGMFAFAMWDGRERELWLVRDRIGIKPLYYHESGSRVRFASEIKAILKDPRVPRRLDEVSLVNYLTFLVAPAPATMFEGIEKVPAGTYVRLRENGRKTSVRYWDPLTTTMSQASVSYPDLVQRAAWLVKDAVRAKSVSDVPVGVFLSGGVDSSTNAALFAKQGGRDSVLTFSIEYDRDYPGCTSEVQYAKQVARHVGAENYVRTLTERDFLDFVPRMIDLQDEPIGDPVAAPVFFVSELARKHGVIVCHVGEGSDELFFGYPVWKKKLQLQSALTGAEGLGGGLVRAAARVGGWTARHRPQGEALRRFGIGLPLFWGGADGFTESDKEQLLGPAIRKARADASREAIRPLYQEFRRSPARDDAGLWMSYLDLKIRLPELLLMRVDKMSMATSIEARVPFLDHPLVEWAMGVPTPVRLHGGKLKAILKDAMRGELPDDILDRKKQGFGVPVHDWSTGRFGAVTASTLTSFAERTGLLDRRAVRSFIARGHGSQLWYLLNLALWHEHWIEGRDVTFRLAS
jgi:asparagine synthase (glutamine-hydrolysing)